MQCEMVLIIIFISLKPSLFEDVLLFVTIGARGMVRQIIRMVVELVLTAALPQVFKSGCEVQKRA